MLATYETVFILRPDLSEGAMKKMQEKLSEVVTHHKGSLAGLKDLGVKQMAYRIKKQMRGHYFQLNYQGEGNLVGELERSLRLSDEVLRFLTVRGKRGRGASRAAEKEKAH